MDKYFVFRLLFWFGFTIGIVTAVVSVHLGKKLLRNIKSRHRSKEAYMMDQELSVKSV